MDTPQPYHDPASGGQRAGWHANAQIWTKGLLHWAKANFPPPAVLLIVFVALYLTLFSNKPQQKPQQLQSAVTDIVFPASNKPVIGPASSPAQLNLVAMATTERTFIAIKPDGVQRGLIGPIISRFENRGYKLVAIKLVSPSKEHLETHYGEFKTKAFFPGLIKYMLSGPICAMVWEGLDAVKTSRTLIGATNPLASAPGTIRGDFSLAVERNVCHGSDSVENAEKEIALWFKSDDIVSWKSNMHEWIY